MRPGTESDNLATNPAVISNALGTFRRIKYNPLPSQNRFHGSLAKFRGFSGSIGSGKSAALVQESIKLALCNAGLLGVVLAPTFPVLRDSTERSFFDVLERNEIPYEHQKSENLVTLTEPGSEILFRSANEFERLRGTNIAWFAFDELTYCEKESWLRMMGRLRHPLASKLSGIAAWTPNGFDWVYDMFVGPNKGDDYEAILATPRENTYLPSDFYDTLARTYDTQFAAQEIEGQYLNIFAGRCYHAFDREIHLKNSISYGFDTGYPLCWSMDFNINPMASVLLQFIDNTTPADRYAGIKVQRAHVIDEIWIQNATTLQACEEFGNRTRKIAESLHGGLQVYVYGDASGGARQTAGSGAPSDWQTVREWFSRHPEYKVSFKYKKANPFQKDRVAAVNGALRSSTGLINMFIDAKCKHLIEDFEKVSWKPGTAMIDKDTDKMLSHISDACGYALEAEMGLRTAGGYSARQLI